MGFLAGKKILIAGLLSNRSIAYGIAAAMKREGAELAFTYQVEKHKDRVAKLAADFDSTLVFHCDVAEDSLIDALFVDIAKHWDGIDSIVHSVAFVPKDALDGDFVEKTTRENFRIAHDISSYLSLIHIYNLQIIPIPAFEDNYIWLIHNGKQALVVDPGDAMPVFARLKQFNLTLSTILITHHHHDHIDGVGQLRAAFPEVKIYAPKLEQYRFVHTPVSEPDIVTISALNLSFKVIDVPGHTFGHIAYYAEPAAGSHWLFSGDVLFGAGCGRVPEESYACLLYTSRCV